MTEHVIENNMVELVAEPGQYITQAAEVWDARVFCTRRVLLPGEVATGWRDATAQEKSEYEAFTPPQQRPCRTVLTPMLLFSKKLSFNDETGYYEYVQDDGFAIRDLTEEDMLNTYYTSMKMQPCDLTNNFYNYNYKTVPTRVAISPYNWMINVNLANAFYSSWIEVLDFNGRIRLASSGNLLTSAFHSGRLKRIYGDIEMDGSTVPFNKNTISNNLERIHLKGAKVNIYVAESAKIELESFAFLVENARNDAPITVTVHLDIYAKLTDEANPDWYAVQEAALAKQIAFATD